MGKAIVARESLIKAIDAVMPGVDTTGDNIFGSDNILFCSNTIYSFKSQICISAKIDGIEGELSGSVNAIALRTMLGKIKKEKLRIFTKESCWVIKDADCIRIEINIIKCTHEEKIHEVFDRKVKWSAVGEDFKYCLMAIPTLEKASDTSWISGVHIKGNNIMSTDGMKLNSYIMDTKFDSEYKISEDAAKELSKYNIAKYYIDKDWIFFKDDSGTRINVAKKKIDDEYMKVINKSKIIIDSIKLPKKNEMLKMPDGMEEAIDRASGFSLSSKDNLDAIRISFNNDNIEVSSGKNTGSYYERIPWPCGKLLDKQISVLINPKIIIDNMLMCKNFVIQSDISKGKMPRIIFIDDNYNGRRVIVTYHGKDDK